MKRIAGKHILSRTHEMDEVELDMPNVSLIIKQVRCTPGYPATFEEPGCDDEQEWDSLAIQIDGEEYYLTAGSSSKLSEKLADDIRDAIIVDLEAEEDAAACDAAEARAEAQWDRSDDDDIADIVDREFE